MTENEFILEDRIAKIQSIIKQEGEERFYLSFSGGKDSTVLKNCYINLKKILILN
jgi:PP-loop superfamily ATP-utilizing enzyme